MDGKQAGSPPVREQDRRGFKRLKRVAELLRALRGCGCERDKAGNRELHFDEYVLLVMFYLMNPVLESMRMLQQAAALPRVREALGVKRFSLGSFSESCRVFEPAMLLGVIDQLAPELRPVGREELLRTLPGRLTLVDGTVLDTLATVAEAMFLPLDKTGPGGRHSHAWRLHLHLDVDHHVPSSFEVTTPRNTGKSDEKNVLRSRLKPGHTYVMDRWYAQFVLWNDIKAAGSSYVCRVRDNSSYDVVEDRVLDAKATDAGVISDQVVKLGLFKKPGERADHPTRLVCVACTPHQKRGQGSRHGGSGQTGPTSDGVLRIATDLLDVPAHVIAFLYQYRWTIEVFIRFFKQTMGCRHLLSSKPEGVQIQVHAAVIVCMLLNALTGQKPSKRTVFLISMYLWGWADESDVLRELNKPDNRGVKLRAKDELWKKLGVK